jgi:hypothetical protein
MQPSIVVSEIRVVQDEIQYGGDDIGRQLGCRAACGQLGLGAGDKRRVVVGAFDDICRDWRSHHRRVDDDRLLFAKLAPVTERNSDLDGKESRLGRFAGCPVGPGFAMIGNMMTQWST